MDPITLAILAGTAGQAISQAGKLWPSEFDRKQKEREAELSRREELGTLGLTDQERAALEGQFQGKAQAVSERADAERARLLAGSGGATTGQALEQATIAQGLQQEQLTQIQQAIEEQDIAEKARETDELRALEAANEQRRKEKVDAIASIAGAGLEAGLGAFSANKLMTPENVTGFSEMMGISPDAARAYLQMNSMNPNLADQTSQYMAYMQMLNNGDE